MNLKKYYEIIDDKKIARLSAVRAYSAEKKLSLIDAEIDLLSNDIIPYRYLGNVILLGTQGQINLMRSRVCIAGCGGLGGFVCELLARLGIGSLVLIDHDVFEEQNLNRQIISSEKNIGTPKVKCAKERISYINSAIKTEIHQVKVDSSNADSLIKNSSLCIDALDNSESKIILENSCIKQNIPLVHGAIGNAQFQVSSVANNPVLKNIYPKFNQKSSAASPACTVAMCAASQVSEAVKIITGMGDVLEDSQILMGNWLYNSYEVVKI
ncbi:MAG: HesA/MoeB/ThiF family protein [Eubacteriales bacterium]